MNLQFSKRMVISLYLILLLVIGAFVGSYYLVIQPLSEKKQAVSSELDFEKKQFDILSQQVQSSEQTEFTMTSQLQRKLPVDPLLDQFILDLHRAEGLSDSYILSINIDPASDYSELVGKPKEEELVEEEASLAEIYDRRLAGDTDESNEGETSTIEYQQIEGMKQLKVHLSVRASTYEGLASFLTEIDQLPRLVNIDSVSFVGRDEMIMIDGEQGSLEFQVEISTFYYPVLEELRDELPQFDYEPPSGKKNPLYES